MIEYDGRWEAVVLNLIGDYCSILWFFCKCFGAGNLIVTYCEDSF